MLLTVLDMHLQKRQYQIMILVKFIYCFAIQEISEIWFT